MKTIVVLTGHGAWKPKDSFGPFVKTPDKCSMHFYTQNFTLMTEQYGHGLEEGKFGGLTPTQTAGPFQNVPNMILTWPHKLTLKSPPPGWRQIKWTKGLKLPTDAANLQFSIHKPRKPAKNPLLDPRGNLHISEIFEVLRPVITAADEVLIVWSACREMKLTPASSPKVVSFIKNNIDAVLAEAKDEGFQLVLGARYVLATWGARPATPEEFADALGVHDQIKNADSPDERWDDWTGVVQLLAGPASPTSDTRQELAALKLNTRHPGSELSGFRNKPLTKS